MIVYKFIKNGQLEELEASNMFDLCSKIRKLYPDFAKKLTLSRFNQRLIK